VSNYEQSNQLQAKYASAGLVLLGFPCDQFDNQEPGENYEILNCLKYARPGGGFVPNFQLFGKLDVNGANTHPVFQYLKESCPATSDEFTDQPYIDWEPVSTRDVTWNFQKFLIDRNGNPFKRYDSATYPMTLEEDVVGLLNQ